MSQRELLKKIIQVLKEAGIEYMATGSFASSLQGEPRSTHDIDFVISLNRQAAATLANAFPPPEFHLDEESIQRAIDQKDMFNLIDVNSGDKADFWILTDEPFDLSRFTRKQVNEIFGLQVAVTSPEDTILMKLKWAKLAGGSEKQFTDALRVYEVQSDNLDLDYMGEWAQKLGVEDWLARLESEAESD